MDNQVMHDRNRRWFLKATGATIATAALAGCTGDDNGAADGDWEDVRTIVLEAYATHWEGVEPDFIAGDENMTLVLYEGEEYTIEWINGDNVTHDIEIQDGDGNVLHVSDEVSTQGESTELTFTATDDMARYECSWHRGVQAGDIEVR